MHDNVLATLMIYVWDEKHLVDRTYCRGQRPCCNDIAPLKHLTLNSVECSENFIITIQCQTCQLVAQLAAENQGVSATRMLPYVE